MKIIITDYVFDASARTITFAENVELSRFLLITNVETNEIIYQFNSAAKGGTVSGNVLTLTFNTSAMSDTDNLQIFYESDSEILDALYQMIHILSFLSAMRGPANDLRTTITGGSIGVTSLPTLATLTNQTMIGGYSATYQTVNLQNSNAILANINNIEVI